MMIITHISRKHNSDFLYILHLGNTTRISSKKHNSDFITKHSLGSSQTQLGFFLIGPKPIRYDKDELVKCDICF